MAYSKPAQEEDSNEMPTLSGAGGGMYFFWQLGFLKYLQKYYDLTRIQFRGASAGALVATLAACQVDPEFAFKSAYQVALDNKVWERKLGLMGTWGGQVRNWLHTVLPADAHVRSAGRLKLVVTEVPLFQQAMLEDFVSKEDLIEAVMASVHVPVFLDWRPLALVRGRAVVDGSLPDIIRGRPSHLLRNGGRALVLHFLDDTVLKGSMLQALKLFQYEEVLEMFRSGESYAERLEQQGILNKHFGSVKLATPPPRESSGGGGQGGGIKATEDEGSTVVDVTPQDAVPAGGVPTIARSAL